jgi:hypothetical protein
MPPDSTNIRRMKDSDPRQRTWWISLRTDVQVGEQFAVTIQGQLVKVTMWILSLFYQIYGTLLFVGFSINPISRVLV